MAEEKKSNNAGKTTFKWKRWTLRTLGVIIILPLILFFLLQIPAVQNVVVDYVTDRINTSIEGDVEIDHIDLSMSKGLKLKGFSLLESEGDTIMVADALNVSLTRSLYSLWDNSIAINKIDLEGPTIRIIKYEGQTKSNLDLILDKLSGSSGEGGEKEPMSLELNEIEVSDFSLALIDENSKEEQWIELENGSIKINKLLENNELDIEYLTLDKPIIRIKKMINEVVVESEVEEVHEIVGNNYKGGPFILGC